MRSASVGAVESARRVEASHSVRGNSDTSGEPGIRLWTGAARTPRGRGCAWAPRELSTQVPAPCRDASQPSATSSAYASETVLRANPRSAARLRDGGSTDPGANRPERTASRSAVSSSSLAPRAPGVMAARRSR